MMSTNRQQLLDWADSGHLDDDKLEQALAVTQSMPSATDNLRFLSRMVLAFAVLLLCSGVVFFFAYNWHDLSRYSKFALAQAAIIVSLLPLLKANLQQPAGQAAMFAASLLVGALLALVGQTYQSGADTYELFLVWAVLITPWVLLARMPALWLLLLILLNASLFLALQNLSTHGLIELFADPSWAVFALNASAAVLWIASTQHQPATRILRWGERVISVYSLLVITYLAVSYINSWYSSNGLGLAVWAIFSGLWLYYYRWRTLDLMMLAALIMAAITVTIALLSDFLYNFIPVDGLLLLMSMLIIGLSSAGAFWLQKLGQRTAASQHSGDAS